MRVTGTVQRQAWQSGELPPVEQLAPDLWSIPVPIPHNPLRYVSVYAFALTGGGIGLIDAGWDSGPGWEALTTGLGGLGASVEDVRRVLVTHLHFDHLGLAGRIRQASGAAIAMHQADAVLVQRWNCQRAAAAAAEEVDFLIRLGANPEEARSDAADADAMEPFLRMAIPDRLLEDGELAEFSGWQLRALHTPGHTAGHLCFFEERTGLLFSGDHVLPRISPNISTTADGAPDPLQSYLSSLAAVRDLEPTEVLPAHEWRFTGLASRVDELRAHHEHRLDELLRVLHAHPHSTPWDLAAHLTWSRPWSSYRRRMRIFAVTETDAHLRLLQSRRLARATLSAVPTWAAAAR